MCVFSDPGFFDRDKAAASNEIWGVFGIKVLGDLTILYLAISDSESSLLCLLM